MLQLFGLRKMTGEMPPEMIGAVISKLWEANSLPVRDFLICYIFLQLLSVSSWCPTKCTVKNFNLHLVRSIFCCDNITIKITSMRRKLRFNSRSNKFTCLCPFIGGSLKSTLSTMCNMPLDASTSPRNTAQELLAGPP